MEGSNEAVPGWWLASDGRWYRPEDLPTGWQIGPGGAPIRAGVAEAPVAQFAPFADVPDAAVPDAAAPDAAAPRSFSVSRAPMVVPMAAGAVGAAGPSRVGALARRWWPVAPALAVLALVIGYVVLGGGDSPDRAQVLGAVENRPTTTAGNVAIGSSSSSSTSSFAGTSTTDPAKLTAGAVAPKATTTTLSVLTGRAGAFGAGATTTVPRSGPVPTTTPPAAAPPATTVPAVPGTPTTQPPSTSAPTAPTSTVGGSPPSTAPSTTEPPTTSRPPSTTRPPTTTSPPSTTTSVPPTTTTAPPTTTVPPTTTAPPTTTTLVPATCSATVSDSTPRDNQNVTINVVSSVHNAPVTLTIRYQFGSVTRTGTTSGVGLAFINFNIGNQPGGFLVVVDVKVGTTATCQTSFRPH